MIRYIVFDFDGTLADSKDVFLRVLNQMTAKHTGITLSKQDVDRLIRLPIQDRCRELRFPVYKLPLFAPEFYRQYKEHIDDVTLFEGMRELLDALVSRGYSLAIISSNSEAIIRDFLRTHGIMNIGQILCSTALLGKDGVIRKFLKQHRLQPSEMIYVGDELRDVKASRKCGVKVVWVNWGYDIPELVLKAQPDFVATRPDDILKAL